MSNEVLTSLLRDYEQKKFHAELDLEKRKSELYKKIPRLQEIEDELNHCAIDTAKNILLNKISCEPLNEKIQKLKYEKACILQDHMLPYNYLSPHYSCLKCCDTGYIQKENHTSEMCTCLKQKLLDISFNKSNMANLNRENFSTFNSQIFSDETDFAKYHFNISPRKNIENIKYKCIEFVENFENTKFKNLLFTGKTGLR